MVSGAMSCIKYLIFFFNLVFAITGIAILVVGGIMQGIYHNYSIFVIENYTFVPIVVIVAGAVIFIISFFGCCGTVKENHCMISTFASLLLIIFLLEVVAGIAGYFFYNDVKFAIETKMTEALDHYATDPQIQKSWDIIQTDFNCCGVNGTVDWKNNIPSSCCPGLMPDETCRLENAFEKGCFQTLQMLVEQHALILIIIAVVVTLIQILGVGFACCLAHSIRKGYETV